MSFKSQKTHSGHAEAQTGVHEASGLSFCDSVSDSPDAVDFTDESDVESGRGKVADSKLYVWTEKVSHDLKEKASDISEGVQSVERQVDAGLLEPEIVSETPKHVHERFALFARDILGVDSVKEQSIEEYYFTRNMLIARYAAVIILCCDVFWLSINALTNNSLNLDASSARIALFAQLAVSLYILLFSYFYKKREGAIIRISFLVFAASIIFGVAGLVDAKNLLAIQQNATILDGQIAFCSIFLIVIILLPLPSLFDSVIVIVMVVCGFLLPFLSPGAAAYSVQQSAILTVLVVFVYFCFWLNCRKSARKNIENARLMQQMAELSYIDSLTYAFNRQAFDTALDYAREAAFLESVGFLIIEVDDFKHYNESYSHSVGDRMLQNVSGIIADALDDDNDDRKNTFLYRYGGAEFIVMLENPTPTRLMTIGIRLKNAVWDANLERSDESEYSRMTITVGCAIEQIKDLKNPEYDAIRNAGIQLNCGKLANKNCVVVSGDVRR